MKLLFAFLLRWIITSFGLWLAIRLFGTGEGTPGISDELTVFLTAGFILSLMNIFIKPLVSIISLPITIVTLGLFTLIINGLMVYLALHFAPGITITFWSAVLVSIVIGIINYGVNETLETFKAK
jgi:putative membrane protein